MTSRWWSERLTSSYLSREFTASHWRHSCRLTAPGRGRPTPRPTSRRRPSRRLCPSVPSVSRVWLPPCRSTSVRRVTSSAGTAGTRSPSARSAGTTPGTRPGTGTSSRPSPGVTSTASDGTERVVMMTSRVMWHLPLVNFSLHSVTSRFVTTFGVFKWTAQDVGLFVFSDRNEVIRNKNLPAFCLSAAEISQDLWGNLDKNNRDKLAWWAAAVLCQF